MCCKLKVSSFNRLKVIYGRGNHCLLSTCVPCVQIKMEAAAGRFKPNCILVIAHFLIRHGLITPDKGLFVGCVHLFHVYIYIGLLPQKGMYCDVIK